MANPSGNHHEASQHASSSVNGGNSASAVANGNSAAPALESSGATMPMKHNPGISMDWTADEQTALEEGLVTFSSDSSIIRYAKIAMKLQNKTVRDVALRCRWMTKKENSKRRKEEHNLSRKSKDKKERVNDPSVKSSHYAARSNVPPYAPPVIPADIDDGISFKDIGGITGDLLEQNAQVLNQISANMASFQIQENIKLFSQTQHNIMTIMAKIQDTPSVMKQMPPLPVKLNEELISGMLGRAI